MVRPYNLILALARRGHQVTVLSPYENQSEKEDADRLRSLGISVETRWLPILRKTWNCLRALPTQTPLQAVYSWQPALAERALELIQGSSDQSIDVIHVEHLRGSCYGLWLRAKGLDSRDYTTPIVWDSVDSIGLLFDQASSKSSLRRSRWLTRFELSRTKRYERNLIAQFDHVLVTSAQDKNNLVHTPSGRTKSSPVSILPNGVDLGHFFAGSPEKREQDVLIATGKMSYHANVTMVLYLVQEIMPLVWTYMPNVKVWIVGKDPVRVVQGLSEDPRVHVTGKVDNVAHYLRRAQISVTPLTYGAGIQNKVLEAMATATPVVASPMAVASMDVSHEREALIAEGSTQFSHEIVRLLQDNNLRRSIGAAGHRYVQAHHDWTEIAETLEGIYDDLIRSRV